MDGSQVNSEALALQLVAGMALAYHKFDPRLRHSKQVGKIYRKLEEVGISIDIGTVRKWLQRAAAYLVRAGNMLSSENKPLNPKERGSLHKLILGMVADRHGLMWGYADGPVPKRIQHDLAQVGINMDISHIAETVREAECDFGHQLIID